MKKKVSIALIISICIVLICVVLFQISRSRTFQIFGEIIPRVHTSDMVVALTFDDGPTKYTTEVLKVLSEKNVKATFFVMGSDLEKSPQFGIDIAQSGHELGNHTYSHERMWFKSFAFISREVEVTNKLIRKTGYQGEIHFRPPYGKKLFGLPWYLSRNNIKTIMWDVEPDTYETGTKLLTKYAIENTKPGSIILLHPFCQTCTNQRAAIQGIVEGLQEKGYRFVTITELLQKRN